MAKVIKNRGPIMEAYELGKRTPAELVLILEGKLAYVGDGVYEVFSQEVHSGPGQKAKIGDFIKIDKAGFPYPNARDWFLDNHKHMGGSIYEQLPKELLAWEATEPLPPEVQFLIENKGLKLSPETPNEYFGAELWGTWLTAAADAVLIFYSVTRDEAGNIVDADFNFVARKEFEATYHYCG